MSIPTYYILLSGMLFLIGCIGAATRKNLIIVFMCVELMLNAANLIFVTAAHQLGEPSGHVFVLFVMAVAAAEAAVGLALILLVFKNYISVNIDTPSLLKS